MEMELENKAIVLPEFKYYKGEEKDPFPEDDIRRKFWWGEQMFSRLDNLEEQFKRFEKKSSKMAEMVEETQSKPIGSLPERKHNSPIVHSIIYWTPLGQMVSL